MRTETQHQMRYISLFSGIEAASLAWEGLGFEPVAFSEIEPFPCAVLAHRFPEVPNLGDITKIDWSDYEEQEIGIIVGGSPCQSFSVAGRREGLSGASGLMFEYIRAVHDVMPRWAVWENVPGALSSEDGEAFGQLLGELDALGYGLAWRVLDAQFFGVAQRRQRLFLVGSLGESGAERACQVLFESDCLQGDSATSREKRKELAARASGGLGTAGGCVTVHQEPGVGERMAIPINTMIATRGGKLGRGTGFGVAEDGDPAYTITATHPHAVCAGFGYKASPGAGSIGYRDEQAPTLLAGRCDASVLIHGGWAPETVGALCASDHKGVSNQLVSAGKVIAADVPTESAGCIKAESVVRRLTPRECERLQGMPDDWTRVPYRGKPAEACPDGPRYKAVGNSMAVPVMRWIGERIQAVEKRSESSNANNPI